MRLPTLWSTGGYGDEGIYMAIARAMHHGAILYVDIWDHKPPILYWIYYLANFAPNWHIAFIILKLIGSILVALILLLFYQLNHRLNSSPKIAQRLALATVAIFFFTTILESQTINAELLFIPVNLTILWCLLKWPRYFIIGMLAGISLLIKANGLIEASLLILCLSWINAPNWRHYLMAMTKAAAGGLLVVSPWLIWVIWHGYWNDTWYAIWQYNQDYTAWAWQQSPVGPLATYAPKLWLLVAICLCLVVIMAWTKNKLSTHAATLTIWLVAAICSATISDRVYGHYFLQAVAPLVLMGQAIWPKIPIKLNRATIATTHLKPSAIIAYTILLVSISIVFLPWQPIMVNGPLGHFYTQPANQAAALASHINQHYPDINSYYLHANAAWALVWTKAMFTNKYIVDYHAGYPNDSTDSDIKSAKLVVVQLSSNSADALIESLESKNWKEVEKWQGFKFYQNRQS